MKNKNMIIATVAIVGFAMIAWYIMTPHNYEDCLLSGMKGISSDAAARGVALACRQKFPLPRDTKYDDIFGIKK
jgi:hypothetical protein